MEGKFAEIVAGGGVVRLACVSKSTHDGGKEYPFLHSGIFEFSGQRLGPVGLGPEDPLEAFSGFVLEELAFLKAGPVDDKVDPGKLFTDGFEYFFHFPGLGEVAGKIMNPGSVLFQGLQVLVESDVFSNGGERSLHLHGGDGFAGFLFKVGPNF